MIKANELRIGNYIYSNSEFDKNGVSFVYSMGYGQITIRTNGAYQSFFVKDLTGIPLTPEFLEKFGFVLDAGGRFELSNVEIWILYNEFRCALNPSLYIDVKYVHQLQNLYFALTGEELNLKI